MPAAFRRRRRGSTAWVGETPVRPAPACDFVAVLKRELGDDTVLGKTPALASLIDRARRRASGGWSVGTDAEERSPGGRCAASRRGAGDAAGEDERLDRRPCRRTDRGGAAASRGGNGARRRRRTEPACPADRHARSH